MFETLRSRFTRLREIVADRRNSPRRRAQRQARLLFNVSVVSDDRYLVDEGCTLRVVLLDLPAGEVEIFCTPRRYEELHDNETGHLIGVEITEMNESDRSRLLIFLKSLH